MFVLGIITGVLFSILFVLIIIYFKDPVIQKVEYIERVVTKKKGFVIEPDEIQEIREDIIKRNSKKGRSTKLAEL